MTPELWKELIGLVARYLVPYLIGVLGFAEHMTEDDRKRLYEIVSSPAFVASTTATLVALSFAVRAWLAKTRVALTAAASSQKMTMQEVGALSKTSAPPLSTRPDELPRLTPPAQIPPPAV